MSRELRRAGGRLSFGGPAVALLVVAAGCEEQLAVRPGYDHQPASGGAGGGGSGGLRGDTGEKVFILVDLVWDGACMHQRTRLEYVTADSRASGGLSTGDLDGDGDDEVAFATGETTFVLDRDENNRLFVRGELPFDRTGMVEPYILDGDGDGDGELWLMNYPGGGSTPPPPSTVWMLPR